MAVNRAKQRMLAGEPAVGAEVSLGSTLSAEIISPMGFDFILVDNQHGSWADQGTMMAFRTIALGVSIPMARVRRNDFGLIGRLLDMGALGIVVPMVSEVEEAREAVFATRYPPMGGRSAGAFAAGIHGPDYDSWANKEIFLAVQIETRTGAKNARDILAVDGIDGCWIGPGDLGRSLGIDRSDPDGEIAHTEAIRGVIGDCQSAGKIPGIWTAAPEDARRWIGEGCLFVTAGNDALWVRSMAKQTLEDLGRL